MKIERNEPCPCGSGKKYKKCCLQKDEDEASRDRSPDVYAHEAHCCLEWRIANALATGRWDALPALANEMAAIATQDFDTFHRVLDQLAVHTLAMGLEGKGWRVISGIGGRRRRKVIAITSCCTTAWMWRRWVVNEG